eukprot:TRINITY_DN338_c0_g1_i1.p1 TRINITY_DN338_c0_g1~~TRINITY_DN338_c0_g1_i1.p1  ORF type:complete len:243 (-),score=30.89 TRINITY_DN338_c0_g1_i1:97-789(-)
MRSLIYIVIILLSITVIEAAVPKKTIEAVSDLYRYTNGWSWRNQQNWLTGDPCENSWFGVTCDARKTQILKIELSNNNLNGFLTNTIDSISSFITVLDLSSNELKGSLPKEIRKLTTLKTLDLSDNKLIGTIPSELNNLASLTTLLLDHNRFTCVDDKFKPTVTTCDLSVNFFQCADKKCPWRKLYREGAGVCALPCGNVFGNSTQNPLIRGQVPRAAPPPKRPRVFPTF